MRQETGTCKYCGQMKVVQLSEDKVYTQEEIDNIAVSECDCDIAKLLRKRTMAFGNLQGMLDERMPDSALDEKEKNIKELILKAGKLMSETFINGVSINAGKENYSLALSPKLTFKLKIKSTETESAETTEV